MSLTDEYTYWHLTPRGWERGTEKTDFGPLENRDTPVDTVLTCKHHEYATNRFSMEKGTKEISRSGSDKEIERLIQKFGNCPNTL